MINDWSIDTLYPTVGSDLESRCKLQPFDCVSVAEVLC